MMGNDGQMYTSVADSRGIYRWKKMQTKSAVSTGTLNAIGAGDSVTKELINHLSLSDVKMIKNMGDSMMEMLDDVLNEEVFRCNHSKSTTSICEEHRKVYEARDEFKRKYMACTNRFDIVILSKAIMLATDRSWNEYGMASPAVQRLDDHLDHIRTPQLTISQLIYKFLNLQTKTTRPKPSSRSTSRKSCDTPSESCTVVDLKKLAKLKGIKGFSKLRKAELLRALSL